MNHREIHLIIVGPAGDVMSKVMLATRGRVLRLASFQMSDAQSLDVRMTIDAEDVKPLRARLAEDFQAGKLSCFEELRAVLPRAVRVDARLQISEALRAYIAERKITPAELADELRGSGQWPQVRAVDRWIAGTNAPPGTRHDFMIRTLNLKPEDPLFQALRPSLEK